MSDSKPPQNKQDPAAPRGNLPPNGVREGYLLVLFDVPESLGGLVSRLGFKPAKKNPNNWWRRFDPLLEGERERAERIRAALKQAGLRGKWSKIELAQAKHVHNQVGKNDRPYAKRGGNWNSGITARPRYGDRGHRRGSGW